MGQNNVIRSAWVCPLITVIASVWVVVHVAMATNELGTHCWFPAESVHTSHDEGGWTFSNTLPTVANGAIPVHIDRPRVPRSCAAWPSMSAGTTYFILSTPAPEIAADPTGFVGALEHWLANEPDGESVHSVTLTTVRAISRAGSPLDPNGSFRVTAPATNWGGVLHNTATISLLFAGFVAAFGWANQAAARRLIALRLASVQCPTCRYDMTGLRGE